VEIRSVRRGPLGVGEAGGRGDEIVKTSVPGLPLLGT
jgi:hypothetical protein